MKRIGILGGTSPESTVSYYTRITHEHTRRFGNVAFPEILIYSVSFQSFVDWSAAGEWDAIAAAMSNAFDRLAAAGAQVGLIAANTLHRVFDEVAASCPIPLLHIVEPTALAIRAAGLTRVGLLGTRYTMEEPFYAERLARHGLSPLVPDRPARDEIHRIIYEELTRGVLQAEAKAFTLSVIQDLASQGAQGIILGCTELPLLVTPQDTALPLFDTAILHADAALDAALR